jgi:hypothetical protein
VNREIGARRTAKEYREAHKLCSGCHKTLPLDAFEVLPSGGLRGTCRDCRAALKAASKRRAREARKAAPEYQAELESKAREREERKAATEASNARAREEREAEREAEAAAARAAAEVRRRKRRDRQRGIRQRPLSPERRREVEARASHLVSLLMGTNPHERIKSEQGWDSATAELQRLWAQTGDKKCVSCKATVPPSAMLPPGPGNSYPGKCQKCAHAESIAHHVRMFGRLPDGPRLMPMRDGTAITVAELARRHREREATDRVQRYGA